MPIVPPADRPPRKVMGAIPGCLIIIVGFFLIVAGMAGLAFLISAAIDAGQAVVR